MFLRKKIKALVFSLKYRKYLSVEFPLEVRGEKYIHFNGKVFLGENCKLLCWKEYTSGLSYQQLNPCLEFGENIHATRNLYIHCAGHISVGDNVTIAGDVFMIDFNHGTDASKSNYLDNCLSIGIIKINNGVWIGNGVTILPNVEIGEHSIIGAGCVVTKNIPAYSLVVGNPGRIIKRYDIEKKRWV